MKGMVIKMIKRFVSILLAIGICAPVLPVLAADSGEIAFSEDFSSYATNAEYDAAYGAYGTRVLAENKNKYLLLNADGDGADISVSTELSGKAILSLDVFFETTPVSAELMTIADGAGKSASLLNFEGGNLFLGDGKRLSGDLKSGKWNNILFKIDLKSKKYGVYINGRAAVEAWRMKGNVPSVIKTFTSVYEGKENLSKIRLDNVRAYEGSHVINNFPSSSYNDEEMYFDENYVPDDSETEVYAGCDFQSGLSGLTYFAKEESKLELTEDGENKFAKFTRLDSDPYTDLSAANLGNKFVVSGDFKVDTFGANIFIFHMRSEQGQFNQLAGITAGGAITTPKGGTVGKAEKGKWVNIACAVNLKKQIYDIYIDGTLAGKKIPFSNSAFTMPSLFRVTFSGSAAKTVLSMDNLYVYSGNDIKEVNGTVNRKMVYTDNSVAEKALSGTAAFTSYNGAAWINNEKVFLENKPLEEDGALWAPAEFFEKAYGAEVKSENGKIYVNNTEVRGKEKGGIIYAEFESVAKDAIKLNYFQDTQRGFAIMGQKSFKSYENPITDYDGNNYLVLSRGEKAYLDPMYYLLYERPSSEEVLEKFNAKSAGQHPRIMATKSDFDRVREEVKTDPYKSKWAQTFIMSADNIVANPKEQKYELYDGERMSSETGTRAITLAFAYQLTGDKKYPEAAYKEIMIVRDFPDWHPKHFLDTAGMSSGIAIAYDWCYDYWSDEQRENIKDALYRHGLKTGYDDLYGGATSRWTAWNNNWAAVCWGSLTMTAIALMDDYPEEASDVVSGGLKGIGYMMPMFAPDGAWAEGPSYWSYCTTHLTRYMASLESAFGTDWGYLNQRGVNGTMLYTYALEGPCGVFNFHDASASNGVDKAPNAYFSKYFGDKKFAQLRLYDLRNASSASIDDFLFLDTTLEPKIPDNLPLDLSYGLTETGVMRSKWFESGATFLGYHSSPNSPVHRNFDSGTFIFDSMGVRWAEELGSDSYVIPNYWATKNNPVYRVRTEGQNCYVINPSADSGQRFESEDKIIKTESKPRGAYAVMDITDAYKDYVTSAKRAVMLGDNRRTFTLRDEIEFKEQSDFYWFMHTKADIKLDGNTAILERSGVKMKFEFISNQPLTLESMDAVPLDSSVSPQNAENTGIRKIVIKGKVSGKLNLTVKMVPQAIESYVSGAEDTPIDEWTLPDGEIPSVKYLTGLFTDGKRILGFSPTTNSYTLLKVAQDPYPQITAECEEGATAAVSGGDGSWSIEVKDNNDPSNVNVYGISIKNCVDTPGTENLRVVMPISYSVSAEPEPSNPGRNIMDADNNTRWSADGNPTVTYEFEEPTEVRAIATAFFRGAERSTFFEIQVSDDGENFTTVKDCTDTSRTEKMSLYEFDPVTTKYIRLYGKGNEISTWFSPTEFYVFAAK